jgi:hypothetical protein
VVVQEELVRTLSIRPPQVLVVSEFHLAFQVLQRSTVAAAAEPLGKILLLALEVLAVVVTVVLQTALQEQLTLAVAVVAVRAVNQALEEMVALEL